MVHGSKLLSSLLYRGPDALLYTSTLCSLKPPPSITLWLYVYYGKNCFLLTQIDTFEPSIPSPSCNISTFLDFDPLAAGIALDLFDSVDTSSHFLERYESTSSNIPTWINRTIPEPELQCHLCELTCGISCSEDCESLWLSESHNPMLDSICYM